MGLVMSDARLAVIEQRIEAMQGRDEWRAELATARSELGAAAAELRNGVAELRSELTELGRAVGSDEADVRNGLDALGRACVDRIEGMLAQHLRRRRILLAHRHCLLGAVRLRDAGTASNVPS